MNANFALQDRFMERFFAGPLAERFYLTGGTALARFYFHHRESLYLDLFTNDFGQDFSQVNQVVLGILHALTLQITSQVVTDTFIQYIVADAAGTSLKVDLVPHQAQLSDSRTSFTNRRVLVWLAMTMARVVFPVPGGPTGGSMKTAGRP